jgi:hypothetical protein
MSINLIAYKSETIEDEVKIENSEGESISSNNLDELINFLCKDYGFSLKTFWNLDTGIAPLLSKIPISELKQLASPSRSSERFFYIPHVLFAIRFDETKSYFYHLEQYYDGEPEETDVQVIKQKALDLIETLKKMNQYATKLTSPVAIYESCVMKHFNLPTILNIPKEFEEIIEYSEATIGRSWVEAFKVGHWNADEIYSLDIQSAYPAIASNLQDFRYSKMFQSDKIPERDKADWGFMVGEVEIYENQKASPIMYRTKEDMTINPIGKWDKEGIDKPYVLTLDEARWLQKRNAGSFKSYNGYFIKFWSEIRPLAVPMQRLFDQRQISSLAKMLCKREAAGVSGKIIQKNELGEVGKWYNPIWGSIIRTRTRLQCADLIYDNDLFDPLIHVGTDGILSEKDVPIRNETKMGSWKKNEPTPAFVLSSGRVYTGDKKPQGLTYDIIKRLIEDKPNSSYYSVNIKRRQTLSDCLSSDELSNIGKMKDFPLSLDLALLRLETDRNFKDFPKNGKELLEQKFSSTPEI